MSAHYGIMSNYVASHESALRRNVNGHLFSNLEQNAAAVLLSGEEGPLRRLPLKLLS